MATAYHHCKLAVADVSGSIYVYAPSLIKMYGNGFVDEVLKYSEEMSKCEDKK